MRILITNDDGIHAPGLAVLHDLACALTAPGNVTTVAPAFEQSGVGHCISYSKPMSVGHLGDGRYAVDGSPADCVITGIFDVMADAPPDLVLSGVNRGNNAAQNTLYSGTVGATMEAAMHGIPSIALSQFIGPENREADVLFEAAKEHGVALIKALLDADLWSDDGQQLYYNVNFPPVLAKNVRGIQATRQGFRNGSPFKTARQAAPNGKDLVWIKGMGQHEPTAEGTDVYANLKGYISVTPCKLDLTAHGIVDELESRL